MVSQKFVQSEFWVVHGLTRMHGLTRNHDAYSLIQGFRDVPILLLK